MARNVTLSQLRSDARLYADERPGSGSSFITETECTRLVNLAIAELYDLLVAARGHEYYETVSTALSTSSGTATVSLPNDFYQLLAVHLQWSANCLEAVPDLAHVQDRHALMNMATWAQGTPKAFRLRGSLMEFFPTPTTSTTLALRYIPAFTDLSADGDTFDGINGWERYVTLRVAIEMRVISQRPYADLERLLEREKERIDGLGADRAAQAPRRIRDTGGGDWGPTLSARPFGPANGWAGGGTGVVELANSSHVTGLLPLANLRGGSSEGQALLNGASNVPAWGALDASKSAAITNLPYFDVRHYGAVGNGTTDDTTAIQSCLTACVAAGGGIVYFPRGTYLVTGIVALNVENVTFRGAGVGVTILQLATAADDHVLNILGQPRFIVVEDMTIDGDRATQTVQCHGLRIENARHVWVNRVEVRDTYHYGIGFAVDGDGTSYLDDIHVTNVYVHDTGGDGIDSKDTNSLNRACFASNVMIESFGLNAALTGQAGFDGRGKWQVTNIRVRSTEDDTTCLRGRSSTGDNVTYSNFYCEHTSSTTSFGLSIGPGSRAVNGFITGAWRGVQTEGDNIRVANVRVVNAADTGFTTNTGSDDVSFVNCEADTCTGEGFDFRGARNKAIACKATSCGIGFLANSASTDARFAFCDASGNTTPFTDSGTGTRVVECAGITASPISKTIAAGVITLTAASYNGNQSVVVDTEASAATDDLDTINGSSAGQLVVLSAANSARTVVARDGTGNLRLAGDFSLDNAEDRLILISDGTSLYELSRSDNGA